MKRIFSLLFLALLLAGFLQAAPPSVLSYQGVLTDTAGVPKTDGTYSVTFTMWTALTGGFSIWSDTKDVTTNNGLFSTTLDMDASILFDAPYYLEIKVGSETLSPRVRITSAAYAQRTLRADTAEFVAGADVGSGINGSNITTGTVSNSRLPSAISQTTMTASDYMIATGGLNVGGTSDPQGNLLVSSGNMQVSSGVMAIGSAPNSTYGLYIDPSAITRYGVAANNTYSGASTKYGIHTTVSTDGTGSRYGTYNYVCGNTAGDYTYGTYNRVIHDGYAGNVYGTYNYMYGTPASGNQWGIYNTGEDYNYFSGAVGIGTSVPDFKLDVHGDAGFNDYLYHNDDEDTYILFNTDYVDIYAGNVNIARFYEGSQDQLVVNEYANDVDFRVHKMTSGTAFVVQASNGYIGFNDASPNYPIHFKQYTTSSAGNCGMVFEASSTTNRWELYHSGTVFNFGNNGTRLAYVATDGAWHVVSDVSLKKNIEALGPVMQKVKALVPVRFHLKVMDDSDPKSIGFIAQEVEKEFPELVSSEADDDIKTIAYSGFGVIAMKAIQEQQAVIEQQQQQIDGLKAEIAAIKEMIGK